MTPERRADLGRFAEPAVLVLVSLTDGPKHGYAIMTDVEAFAGTPMGPGTLYAVLSRLEESGLITALRSSDRRRPYAITPAGEVALAAQLDEMDRLLRIGRARAGRAPSGLP